MLAFLSGLFLLAAIVALVPWILTGTLCLVTLGSAVCTWFLERKDTSRD